MIYVGLDIAANKHNCCILSEERKVIRQFRFSNTADGFEKLRRSLSAPSETKIGLESTGVYGNNLAEFLRRNGYKTHIFNPLLIKKSIQATTLRKTKTDKADARYIAQYTMEHSQPDQELSYHTLELKSLSRGRLSLVRERSKLKTLVKDLLVQVFPEFRQAFSDVFGAAAQAVLKEYPSAAAIAKCDPEVLTKLLEENSRSRLGKGTAELLIDLARHSIGSHSAALELEMQAYLEQIALLDRQIKRYESAIKAAVRALNTPLTTIPGIGYVLAGVILGEIGDIRRFASPAKLQAYAGVEPSIGDSGATVSAPGHMVKHGSHYLRWARRPGVRPSLTRFSQHTCRQSAARGSTLTSLAPTLQRNSRESSMHF